MQFEILIWPLICLVVTWIFLALIRKVSWKYNLLVFPRQDRWNKQSASVFGGLAVCLAWTILGLFYLYLNHIDSTLYYIILLISTFLALAGLVDDKFSLPLYVKILLPLVSCLFLLFNGLIFNLSPNPLINCTVSLFWLIFILQAINVMDNMDGLVAGNLTIAMFFLTIIGLGNKTLIVLLCLGIATLIGFLPFNFSRKKIFLGDSGSNYLGIMYGSLGILAINATSVPNKLSLDQSLAFLLPLGLISLAPILDASLATINRLIHRKAVFQGGLDHPSHIIAQSGLSERWSRIIYYTIGLIGGIFALIIILFPQSFFGVLGISLFLTTLYALAILKRSRQLSRQ